MAFSANKYNNKNNLFTFKTPIDFEYTTLDVLFNENGNPIDKVYPVKAMFLNRKSMYGTHPVIVTDRELVDLPKHLLDTVKDMIADEECVDAINNGKVGFQIYQYIDSKYKKTCYSVTWVDIN